MFEVERSIETQNIQAQIANLKKHWFVISFIRLE